MWATKQAIQAGFSSGGQMNLTANPSRSPKENKVYHQKCISQLGLYQKGELREKVTYRLICCFPAGNGFNMRHHAQASFSIHSMKDCYPMPSVRRVLCWAQDTTVKKPRPWSQDARAELLTPPEVPPTLVPGTMKLFAESFPRS